MSVSPKTKRPAPFPRAKIAACVAEIMPRGKEFELRVADSLLPDLKVVRVVTDAWRRQPNTERILKVIKAVRPALTEEENERILRFSVLTSAEYAEVVESKAGRTGMVAGD